MIWPIGIEPNASRLMKRHLALLIIEEFIRSELNGVFSVWHTLLGKRGCQILLLLTRESWFMNGINDARKAL
ncbi:hypothetical protein B5G02_05700 [[Collinsella] massiliensis]|uniref:Uncharacterized protein n=1 Tax=[Collinsella] massiliensis TaxID=1232426 RepID=A0A1Y3Y2K4_9ACTN|nr:hypothetical protein B5G02_05700 [[Collinsella] massiliensis]